MRMCQRNRGLTSKLLLEYRHEGVGGSEVELSNGLEHVAGRDALA